MFSKAPIIALTQLDRTTNTFVGKNKERKIKRDKDKEEKQNERERESGRVREIKEVLKERERRKEE